MAEHAPKTGNFVQAFWSEHPRAAGVVSLSAAVLVLAGCSGAEGDASPTGGASSRPEAASTQVGVSPTAAETFPEATATQAGTPPTAVETLAGVTCWFAIEDGGPYDDRFSQATWVKVGGEPVELGNQGDTSMFGVGGHDLHGTDWDDYIINGRIPKGATVTLVNDIEKGVPTGKWLALACQPGSSQPEVTTGEAFPN